MSAPLYERMLSYARQERVSFAMPGHKGRGGFGGLINADATELRASADLHAESEAVKKANALLSRLYKSKRSFILSGGSTAAVFSMLSSALRPGETLLTTPDCHMSVINFCALYGVNIRVARKDFNDRFMIYEKISSVSRYLDRYPDIRAVLVTSPDYYGVCADTRRIAGECHAHGKPLIVDAAHGAHFTASGRLPECPAQYADLVCHSAHKTLNALTGAAYLHVNGGIIPPERVRERINMFETSSPSYVIAASADRARAELEDNGGWDETIDLCEKYKRKFTALGIEPLENDDPTRVVLSLAAFDITGFEAERLLSERYRIDAEMADARSLVLIVTPKNTESDFECLYGALAEIASGAPARENTAAFPPPERTGLIRPSAAFYADGEGMELSLAAGRISRATVTAYPPGTPVIITGEVITDALISAVAALSAAGAKITGMNGNMIDTVRS